MDDDNPWKMGEVHGFEPFFIFRGLPPLRTQRFPEPLRQIPKAPLFTHLSYNFADYLLPSGDATIPGALTSNPHGHSYLSYNFADATIPGAHTQIPDDDNQWKWKMGEVHKFGTFLFVWMKPFLFAVNPPDASIPGGLINSPFLDDVLF